MKGMETALAALLRSSRRLWICRAVFGLFIIVVIVTDSADIIRNTSDIDVFLHASEQILVGQDIYATSISEHRRFYVYLPLLAVLLIPLAGLLQEFVIVCWITFDVILLGWVIHAFYKWINGNSLFDLKRETRWTLYVVVLALCLDTVLFHLRHGQTNVQVLALAVLAAGFAAKKKELAAGLILGIAAVIKIIVFPIAAFLIFQRGARVAL
jgi:hypothetical protein